ncbi:MAG: putative cytokinetic ring protein SteA [Actinomycetota bacterium]
MRLRTRIRFATVDSGSALEGTVRLGKRTKQLIGRIQPDEIVVIDHQDLDRIAAEGLVEKQVKAVINASSFCTGRYPNLGALVLCGAGIFLIEKAGPDVFESIKDGERIRIEEGRVFRGDEVVAKGEVVTLQDAEDRLDASKRNISNALEAFAENTLEYMINEKDFLLEAIRLPQVRTNFSGRHVLVVVRGYGYKKDLASLRGYINDLRPILVAVDGGADALLEMKLTPDVIIGDMDSVSTKALSSGAELVVHAFADGVAPGAERLDALHLDYATFEAPGTSEDVAMLLAHEKGAELIVAVGARVSLVEFMDKGRKGMASTFLVRLRVGPKLVDAKGVGELHRSGPNRWELFGLVGAAIVTMLIVVGISQPMQLVLKAAGDWLSDMLFILGQAVG